MSEVRKLKIRKNLNRWSRKLLICIGLENIGKHLVGEDKWQNAYPTWRDSEQDTPGDFDPSEVAEQDIASADLSQNDPSDTPDEETNDEKNDNFLHLLPYWYFVNRAFGNHAGTVLGAGNPSDEDLSTTTSSSLIEAFDAQRLNSLLLFETLKQQIQLQSGGGSQIFENPFNPVQNLSFDAFEAAKKLASARLAADSNSNANNCLPLTLPDLTVSVTNHDDQEENDQPLDLTQKSKSFDGDMHSRKQWSLMDTGEVSSSSVKGMKVPDGRVTKVTTRPNQRAGRGYTTQELEAALRDIQSGKLGTRRAAVIYGIPRSTLRNKVYKMGKDRSRPYFRQRAPMKGDGEGDEGNGVEINPNDGAVLGHNISGDVTNSGGKSMLLPILPVTSSLTSVSQSQSGPFAGGGGGDGGESEEEESKLDEDMSHEKRVLKEWLRTKLSRQGLQLQNMSSEHLLKSGTRALSSLDPMSDSSDNSDEVSRRRDVILKIPSLLNKSSLNRVISRKKLKRKAPKDEDDQTDQDYILKNMNSGEAASTVTIGEMTLDELDRGNNSKNNDDIGNDSGDEMDVEMKYASMIKRQYDKAHLYDRKEPMASSSAQGSANNSTASSVSDANGKKSRPKRGKYRNYDRDALLKAVRAVQNGEMSVHRAGSFYGVPHSTLEYKVKERHLLRRPKRKGVTSPKPSHKSSPESSMSGSEPPAPRHMSASAGVLESNHLPLTPDLRESLSRYLNIGQGMNLYSSATSPDPPRPTAAKKTSLDGKGRDYRVDNHAVGLGRTMSNPFLNLFHLDDLIRHNLDNDSLLDLTKKS